MNELLRQALDLVLTDVRATTDVELRVDDSDWVNSDDWSSVMLWAADGSGTGVSIPLGAPEPQGIALVADQVQDLVVEDHPGRASNWPACPAHPSSHPMDVDVVDGTASWTCPKGATVATKVGELRL